eukprot:gene4043-2895_t
MAAPHRRGPERCTQCFGSEKRQFKNNFCASCSTRHSVAAKKILIITKVTPCAALKPYLAPLFICEVGLGTVEKCKLKGWELVHVPLRLAVKRKDSDGGTDLATLLIWAAEKGDSSQNRVRLDGRAMAAPHRRGPERCTQCFGSEKRQFKNNFCASCSTRHSVAAKKILIITKVTPCAALKPYLAPLFICEVGLGTVEKCKLKGWELVHVPLRLAVKRKDSDGGTDLATLLIWAAEKETAARTECGSTDAPWRRHTGEAQNKRQFKNNFCASCSTRHSVAAKKILIITKVTPCAALKPYLAPLFICEVGLGTVEKCKLKGWELVHVPLRLAVKRKDSDGGTDLATLLIWAAEKGDSSQNRVRLDGRAMAAPHRRGPERCTQCFGSEKRQFKNNFCASCSTRHSVAAKKILIITKVTPCAALKPYLAPLFICEVGLGTVEKCKLKGWELVHVPLRLAVKRKDSDGGTDLATLLIWAAEKGDSSQNRVRLDGRAMAAPHRRGPERCTQCFGSEKRQFKNNFCASCSTRHSVAAKKILIITKVTPCAALKPYLAPLFICEVGLGTVEKCKLKGWELVHVPLRLAVKRKDSDGGTDLATLLIWAAEKGDSSQNRVRLDGRAMAAPHRRGPERCTQCFGSEKRQFKNNFCASCSTRHSVAAKKILIITKVTPCAALKPYLAPLFICEVGLGTVEKCKLKGWELVHVPLRLAVKRKDSDGGTDLATLLIWAAEKGDSSQNRVRLDGRAMAAPHRRGPERCTQCFGSEKRQFKNNFCASCSTRHSVAAKKILIITKVTPCAALKPYLAPLFICEVGLGTVEKCKLKGWELVHVPLRLAVKRKDSDGGTDLATLLIWAAEKGDSSQNRVRLDGRAMAAPHRRGPERCTQCFGSEKRQFKNNFCASCSTRHSVAAKKILIITKVTPCAALKPYLAPLFICEVGLGTVEKCKLKGWELVHVPLRLAVKRKDSDGGTDLATLLIWAAEKGDSSQNRVRLDGRAMAAPHRRGPERCTQCFGSEKRQFKNNFCASCSTRHSVAAKKILIITKVTPCAALKPYLAPLFICEVGLGTVEKCKLKGWELVHVPLRLAVKRKDSDGGTDLATLLIWAAEKGDSSQNRVRLDGRAMAAPHRRGPERCTQCFGSEKRQFKNNFCASCSTRHSVAAKKILIITKVTPCAALKPYLAPLFICEVGLGTVEKCKLKGWELVHVPLRLAVKRKDSDGGTDLATLLIWAAEKGDSSQNRVRLDGRAMAAPHRRGPERCTQCFGSEKRQFKNNFCASCSTRHSVAAKKILIITKVTPCAALKPYLAPLFICEVGLGTVEKCKLKGWELVHVPLRLAVKRKDSDGGTDLATLLIWAAEKGDSSQNRVRLDGRAMAAPHRRGPERCTQCFGSEKRQFKNNFCASCSTRHSVAAKKILIITKVTPCAALKPYLAPLFICEVGLGTVEKCKLKGWELVHVPLRLAVKRKDSDGGTDLATLLIWAAEKGDSSQNRVRLDGRAMAAPHRRGPERCTQCFGSEKRQFKNNFCASCSTRHSVAAKKILIITKVTPCAALKPYLAPLFICEVGLGTVEKCKLKGWELVHVPLRLAVKRKDSDGGTDLATLLIWAAEKGDSSQNRVRLDGRAMAAPHRRGPERCTQCFGSEKRQFKNNFCASCSTRHSVAAKKILIITKVTPCAALKPYLAPLFICEVGLGTVEKCKLKGWELVHVPLRLAVKRKDSDGGTDLATLLIWAAEKGDSSQNRVRLDGRAMAAPHRRGPERCTQCFGSEKRQFKNNFCASCSTRHSVAAKKILIITKVTPCAALKPYLAPLFICEVGLGTVEKCKLKGWELVHVPLRLAVKRKDSDGGTDLATLLIWAAEKGDSSQNRVRLDGRAMAAPHRRGPERCTQCFGSEKRQFKNNFCASCSTRHSVAAKKILIITKVTPCAALKPYLAPLFICEVGLGTVEKCKLKGWELVHVPLRLAVKRKDSDGGTDLATLLIWAAEKGDSSQNRVRLDGRAMAAPHRRGPERCTQCFGSEKRQFKNNFCASCSTRHSVAAKKILIITKVTPCAALKPYLAPLFICEVGLGTVEKCKLKGWELVHVPLRLAVKRKDSDGGTDLATLLIWAAEKGDSSQNRVRLDGRAMAAPHRRGPERCTQCFGSEKRQFKNNFCASCSTRHSVAAKKILIITKVTPCAALKPYLAPLFICEVGLGTVEKCKLKGWELVHVPLRLAVKRKDSDGGTDLATLLIWAAEKGDSSQNRVRLDGRAMAAPHRRGPERCTQCFGSEKRQFKNNFCASCSTRHSVAAKKILIITKVTPCAALKPYLAPLFICEVGLGTVEKCKLKGWELVHVPLRLAVKRKDSDGGTDLATLLIWAAEKGDSSQNRVRLDGRAMAAPHRRGPERCTQCFGSEKRQFKNNFCASCSTRHSVAAKKILIITKVTPCAALKPYLAPLFICEVGLGTVEKCKLKGWELVHVPLRLAVKRKDSDGGTDLATLLIWAAEKGDSSQNRVRLDGRAMAAPHRRGPERCTQCFGSEKRQFKNNFCASCSTRHSVAAKKILIITKVTPCAALKPYLAPLFICEVGLGTVEKCKLKGWELVHVPLRLAVKRKDSDGGTDLATLLIWAAEKGDSSQNRVRLDGRAMAAPHRRGPERCTQCFGSEKRHEKNSHHNQSHPCAALKPYLAPLFICEVGLGTVEKCKLKGWELVHVPLRLAVKRKDSDGGTDLATLLIWAAEKGDSSQSRVRFIMTSCRRYEFF